MTQKWMIRLNDEQLKALSTDALAMGDLLTSPDGDHYLLFRDSFVALKVATSVGAERSTARVLPPNEAVNPLAFFNDGSALVSEFV